MVPAISVRTTRLQEVFQRFDGRVGTCELVVRRSGSVSRSQDLWAWLRSSQGQKGVSGLRSLFANFSLSWAAAP